MASVANTQSMVVRTTRGLSIAGTRITLYGVMDYVAAGWPAHAIRDRLQLADQQISDATAYIEANRVEVEREYRAVLQTAEENRRYWHERNQVRLAPIALSATTPEEIEVRAKLQAWRDHHRQPRSDGRSIVP